MNSVEPPDNASICCSMHRVTLVGDGRSDTVTGPMMRARQVNVACLVPWRPPRCRRHEVRVPPRSQIRYRCRCQRFARVSNGACVLFAVAADKGVYKWADNGSRFISRTARRLESRPTRRSCPTARPACPLPRETVDSTALGRPARYLPEPFPVKATYFRIKWTLSHQSAICHSVVDTGRTLHSLHHAPCKRVVLPAGLPLGGDERHRI